MGSSPAPLSTPKSQRNRPLAINDSYTQQSTSLILVGVVSKIPLGGTTLLLGRPYTLLSDTSIQEEHIAVMSGNLPSWYRYIWGITLLLKETGMVHKAILRKLPITEVAS
mgnify:CR=1 FL=1